MSSRQPAQVQTSVRMGQKQDLRDWADNSTATVTQITTGPNHGMESPQHLEP